jgi:hypothetical protein
VGSTKGGIRRHFGLEEVTLRRVRRVQRGSSIEPRDQRLHRLVALLHRLLALLEEDLAVVDTLLVEVLGEEPVTEWQVPSGHIRHSLLTEAQLLQRRVHQLHQTRCTGQLLYVFLRDEVRRGSQLLLDRRRLARALWWFPRSRVESPKFSSKPIASEMTRTRHSACQRAQNRATSAVRFSGKIPKSVLLKNTMRRWIAFSEPNRHI